MTDVKNGPPPANGEPPSVDIDDDRGQAKAPVRAQGTALDRVRAALERHGSRIENDRGHAFKAQCPAHSDNNPSLKVTGIEGSVLLYCHAGCEYRSVLAALDLSEADLFDNREGATYRYTDGRRVHRKAGKEFRQSGNKGGDALYRLDKVRATVAAKETIWVPEGEKDVHALESRGVTATCSAMGAGKAHLADWSPLAGANVVIVADKDDAGAAHARQVADILRGLDATVKVVRAKAGKDAADHIAAGHGLGDFEPWVEPRPADQYQDLDLDDLFANTANEPDWLVPDVIERGRLHALYAPSKTGKSLLVQYWATTLATQGIHVVYVDLENSRADIRTRFGDMGYRPSDLKPCLHYLSFPNLPMLDTPKGGADIVDVADDRQAELVVIDTTARVIKGAENDSDTFRALYR